MSLIIIFSPLLGSLILLFSRELTERSSSIIANLSIGISALTSLILLVPFLIGDGLSSSIFYIHGTLLEIIIFNLASS
jgi:NADH:ubiquinone oxidoreductase subunit 5 (subunit L)/multisubunit Na+/H+ antiporter MnhA subunit